MYDLKRVDLSGQMICFLMISKEKISRGCQKWNLLTKKPSSKLSGLLYFDINKLATTRYCLVTSGRRCDALALEIKDIITESRMSISMLESVSFAPPPQVSQDDAMGLNE